ncbi:serine carboxypeptidase S28-domain-containing protein [Phanerochaete sordida]|uniref:Serine carboxypeptidase S28-domain-containing protein n=1 Tax=Phanerochaete sordida TaxID=48140 RepID=A0A9P3LIM1_9APHY|nr:serine carboxypeptidase S28-domain-containing protein [Phanerochaete sordida]
MAPGWRLASALLALAASGAALARLPDGRLHGNMPRAPAVPPLSADDLVVTDASGAALPPLNTTYLFDQLIDHTNPKLGTFKQRFWTTWEFYEKGGPIVLFTPGEVNGAGYTGYLTNRTVNGQIAQQQKGATIVLEHRFYGNSTPFGNLEVSSLRFHTIQQAIDDLEYFANNVVLPMPGGDAVKPNTQAPWVLVGGSYSGALTSWAMVNKPNLFRAGYASSAVVEAILDYWGYFEPIRQFMPKNCSADVEAVIAHVDKVFTSGTKAEIDALKANWGMQDLTHLDDVAGSLRNNLWDWQSLSPDTGSEGQFFQFCDALEVKNGTVAPASGFGLEHALTAWGSYWNSTYLKDVCGKTDVVDCLGSYNSSQTYYSDTSLGNDGRSWEWIVCTQVGFLQDGPPQNHPAVVTRLVQPSYDERQCTYFFPEAFPKPTAPNVQFVNEAYKGWNVSIDRLFFANGQRDPWRESTVSADGATTRSTNEQPIAVGDGFHCSDLITENGSVDPTVLAVQQRSLTFMKTWLEGFKPSKPAKRSYSPRRKST